MGGYTLANKILVLIIDSIALWLGLRIFLFNKKEIGRFFLLMSLSLIGWITSGYLCGFYQNLSLACFFCRLNIFFVGLFFIFIYLFTLSFPKKKKESNIFKYFLLSTILIFSILISFTKIGVVRVEKGFLKNSLLLGPYLNYFYLFILICTGVIFYNLLRGYSSLSPEEKEGVNYFLGGAFLFAFFNVIFNIFIPLLKGTINYYQFGDYSSVFFLLMVSLGVIKKHLFGIKIIIMEVFVVLLTALILSQVFVFSEKWQVVWSLFLFLLSIFLGYTSIKSIEKEMRQKEEIERAYKMMEKFNKELDRRVKERTKVLEEKIEELNKFYRLTVGRELKMIDLKKKIEELEKRNKEIDR